MKPAHHEDCVLLAVPSRVVAHWPVGTFVENIVVLDDGDFCLSVHNQRKLLRVTPAGKSSAWIDTPTSPAGLVRFGEGVLFVGGEIGTSPHHVYHVAEDGTVTAKLAVPDSLFLNGFTPGKDGRAYTVDSLLGAIIEVDTRRWTSRVLLQDARLTKCSDGPMPPGVNGIKLGDGCLYVTNTDRASILRAALHDDGRIGELEVIAEALRGDDLAVASDGDLFIANHFHNTVMRLSLGGEKVAIAGPNQGMAGSTACAFHPADPGALYVTTTGGIVMPLDGVTQEARLVRLEVGVGGRPMSVLD